MLCRFARQLALAPAHTAKLVLFQTAVNRALSGQPFVNFLLRESAGTARSLGALASSLFPGHAQGRKAVEVLVTFGSIAREQQGEPGLIPARIHGFFRGLHALYACINPACTGRQDRPGEVAVLGKLFAAPHASCVACAASGWNCRCPPRPKPSMMVFSRTDWFTGLMRKPSSPAASAAVEANVHWSMRQLAAIPAGRRVLDCGQLVMVGAVYDLNLGRVRYLES